MPKVLLLIIFGLLGLPLTGFSGRAGLQPHLRAHAAVQSPEVRQATANRIASEHAATVDVSQDCDRPLLDRQDPRSPAGGSFRAYPEPYCLVTSGVQYIAGRCESLRKMQASGYRERSFDYYALLIYPHHGFW